MNQSYFLDPNQCFPSTTPGIHQVLPNKTFEGLNLNCSSKFESFFNLSFTVTIWIPNTWISYSSEYGTVWMYVCIYRRFSPRCRIGLNYTRLVRYSDGNYYFKKLGISAINNSPNGAKSRYVSSYLVIGTLSLSSWKCNADFKSTFQRRNSISRWVKKNY